jgi:hypothetical protein
LVLPPSAIERQRRQRLVQNFIRWQTLFAGVRVLDFFVGNVGHRADSGESI